MRILTFCLLLLSACFPAAAQTAWPTGRTLLLVITYPPGGTTDFVARFFARHLAEQLAVPVVVENRPGGGEVVGWTHVVRSPPDGTNFLLTDNSLATAPPLHPQLGFDIRADLTPISRQLIFRVSVIDQYCCHKSSVAVWYCTCTGPIGLNGE